MIGTGLMHAGGKTTESPQDILASLFRTLPEWMKPGDISFSGEEDFVRAVNSNAFDVVIGDPVLKRAVPDFRGEWISFVHFAVSGKLESENEEETRS